MEIPFSDLKAASERSIYNLKITCICYRSWDVSGLGLGLSVLWTGASQRGYSIARVSDWTSHKTAVHARLEHRKGSIRVGHDADLIIWDRALTTTPYLLETD